MSKKWVTSLMNMELETLLMVLLVVLFLLFIFLYFFRNGNLRGGIVIPKQFVLYNQSKGSYINTSSIQIPTDGDEPITVEATVLDNVNYRLFSAQDDQGGGGWLNIFTYCNQSGEGSTKCYLNSFFRPDTDSPQAVFILGPNPEKFMMAQNADGSVTINNDGTNSKGSGPNDITCDPQDGLCMLTHVWKFPEDDVYDGTADSFVIKDGTFNPPSDPVIFDVTLGGYLTTSDGKNIVLDSEYKYLMSIKLIDGTYRVGFLDKDEAILYYLKRVTGFTTINIEVVSDYTQATPFIFVPVNLGQNDNLYYLQDAETLTYISNSGRNTPPFYIEDTIQRKMKPTVFRLDTLNDGGNCTATSCPPGFYCNTLPDGSIWCVG